MLKTGTVPVSDAIQRLPAAANGESKWTSIAVVGERGCLNKKLTIGHSQGQDYGRRGRRRGRAQKAAGGDGLLGRWRCWTSRAHRDLVSRHSICGVGWVASLLDFYLADPPFFFFFFSSFRSLSPLSLCVVRTKNHRAKRVCQ